MNRHARRIAIAVAVVGLLGIADAARIQLKAWAAQWLLARSWDAAQASGLPAPPPWPWADTRPIARLIVPALEIDQFVLAGASGRNLAFGPVHVTPSAQPGVAGHVVLSGHRDTHFRFLRALEPGMSVRLVAADGQVHHFEVGGREVVNVSSGGVSYLPGLPRLTLVTCEPEATLGSNTPLRLVVHAERV